MGRGGYRGKGFGKPAPGNTEASLNRFLAANPNSPLARNILDNNLVEENWLTGVLEVNTGRVQAQAKSFVRWNRDISYGRDYVISLAKSDALERTGRILTDAQALKYYNNSFKIEALALRTAARAGRVRLTAAQNRYLDNAIRGNYIGLQFTTDSSVRGSLANATRRRRGGGADNFSTDSARRAARLNFLEITGRLR